MRIYCDSFLCNLRVVLEPYSTSEMRTLFFFCFFFLFSKESGESARRPAEMATADLPKDSKPPLTLRLNFKSEKGSVTAAAAACSPRRGIFVGESSQGKKGSPERGAGKPQA